MQTLQNCIGPAIRIGREIRCLPYAGFSKHRPFGPMLSISRFVRLWSVCVCVCVSVHFLRYRLTVFLPPLPEVGCPIFLKLRNPWGKVMERSGLTFKNFVWKWSKIAAQKKVCFFADFALQNMVETTLPNGLETTLTILAYL